MRVDIYSMEKEELQLNVLKTLPILCILILAMDAKQKN